MLPNILKPFKSNKQNLLRVGPKKDGGYIIDQRVIKKSKTVEKKNESGWLGKFEVSDLFLDVRISLN